MQGLQTGLAEFAVGMEKNEEVCLETVGRALVHIPGVTPDYVGKAISATGPDEFTVDRSHLRRGASLVLCGVQAQTARVRLPGLERELAEKCRGRSDLCEACRK